MLVHYGRVDQLTDALFVSAWEEYQVVGLESEIWGRPGERMEKFGLRSHRIVGFYGKLGSSLELDQFSGRC